MPSATSGAGSAEYVLPSARIGLPGACNCTGCAGTAAHAGTLTNHKVVAKMRAHARAHITLHFMAWPP
ncbi:hypothetical protein Xcc3_17590 [Xanthomonas campestris pv. campestris]|nr:hypothetical protein Xcc3_17590 [Xanthomonas campestris pv. campestris]